MIRVSGWGFAAGVEVWEVGLGLRVAGFRAEGCRVLSLGVRG